MTDPGKAFAEAFASKNPDLVRAATAPDIDVMALTPRRFWEARGQDELVEILFGSWVGPSDEVVELLSTESGEVASRRRVSYRMHLRNPDGEFVMEQQMYYQADENRITWARIVCSGYVPLPG